MEDIEVLYARILSYTSEHMVFSAQTQSQIDAWTAAWERGVQDFNQGRYWHAHESWEANWTKLPEPHRSWTKALIQVCGVFVHVEKRRPEPALRLALRSLELMAGAAAHARLHEMRPALEVTGAEETMLRVAAFLKAGLFDPEFLLSLAKPLRARVRGKE